MKHPKSFGFLNISDISENFNFKKFLGSFNIIFNQLFIHLIQHSHQDSNHSLNIFGSFLVIDKTSRTKHWH